MKPLRVVVADDDALARELVELTVERSAQAELVATANDGWQAIAAAEDADVLLLDATMPGPGLEETVRQIRQLHPTVSIVLVTGAARVDADRMAESAGIDLQASKGDVSGLLGILDQLSAAH